MSEGTILLLIFILVCVWIIITSRKKTNEINREIERVKNEILSGIDAHNAWDVAWKQAEAIKANIINERERE